MTTVADILKYIETIAPPYMKMDWDNVGLLCGSGAAPVTKVMTALDPFEDVCREAADWGAELIVTHHPLIFHPLKAVTDGTDVGRSIGILCRCGISAIAAHTNLDCAPGGVNDVLAAKLGLSGIRVVHPQGVDEQGQEWGLLRRGTVKEQSLAEFLTFVKRALGCEGLRCVDGGKPVCKVAVGGGACGSELMQAVEAGCDTFVTSDISYNDFWDAKAQGLNLIDAGHFYTENPVVSVLAEKIAVAFPGLQVKISGTHRDCMKFF